MGYSYPTRTQAEIIGFLMGQPDKDTDPIRFYLNPTISCRFVSDYRVSVENCQPLHNSSCSKI